MSETFQPGFGAQLKAAREAKELTVARVADKLKLTTRQIEAMEQEDLSHLPGAVFVRGFIRNYARLVELDPESLIAPVDAEATVSETITARSEGVRFASSGVKRWVILPLLGLAGFVVLVALLYHWLRQGEDALLTAPGTIQSAPEVMQPLPAPVAPLAPGVPSPSAVPPATVIPADDARLSTAVAPTTQSAPGVSIPAQAASAPIVVAPTASADTAAANHSLRFEPGQDAWIQVVDAKGRHFSKLVRAGSVETFSGDTPFRLVVGEAAQVRLTFDGHKIDLSPFIGQKVARLTLE